MCVCKRVLVCVHMNRTNYKRSKTEYKTDLFKTEHFSFTFTAKFVSIKNHLRGREGERQTDRQRQTDDVSADFKLKHYLQNLF